MSDFGIMLKKYYPENISIHTLRVSDFKMGLIGVVEQLLISIHTLRVSDFIGDLQIMYNTKNFNPHPTRE